ncbi:hypothetical protein D3C78_947790 [compost metagenome]
MLVDHLPEARGVRVVGHAFEHQAGGGVGQGAVDDIAVAGDPAHVSRAPVDIAFVVVEDVLVGHGRAQQVAAGGVQHALGFAGGARCVEDEQRVLGVHPLRRALLAGAVQGLVVPDVATLDPDDFALGALDHHHRGNIGAVLQRLVDVLLQRDVLATAHALVGGDHGAAVGVEYAVAQGIGGEAAEYHRVHGADACAGEHGVGRLGDHRHVDADPIAFLHAALFQHVGQATHMAVQLAVGDLRGFGGVVAFPDEGDLVAALFQVAVDAVIGDVQLAALEPLGLALLQIAAVQLVPGFEPGEEAGRLLAPEQLGLLDGLLIQALVGVVVDQGVLAHGVRHGVKADLVHGGVLVVV